MKDTFSPEYDHDDEDEALSAQAPTTYQPAPAAPLPNPVLRSFESPAAPVKNTVPQVERAEVPTAKSQAQPPVIPTFQAPVVAPAPALRLLPAPPAIPPQAPAPVSMVYQPGVTAPDPRYSPEYQQQEADEAQQRAEEQRVQYQRDRQASLRYLKGQGGRTKILPTGEETEDTDEQGRQLYHPAVLNPLERGEDGRAYRVSRDHLGQTQRFDLERDGAEGQDFHVDPQSGERYVTLSGADGGSKREVIGQDAYMPRLLTGGLPGHRQPAPGTGTGAAKLDQHAAAHRQRSARHRRGGFTAERGVHQSFSCQWRRCEKRLAGCHGQVGQVDNSITSILDPCHVPQQTQAP